MRAATILACLIFPIGSMPAQARDYDSLSAWSLEDLCEKKDKRRHTEAIFAELERRAAFTPLDLRLVRFGWTKIGMAESALECLWGAPDSESQADGAAAKTYRHRIDGESRTIDVFFAEGRVTDIRMRPVEYPPWPGAGGFSLETISEELLWSGRNGRNWGQ
jgi:hypothetical protein